MIVIPARPASNRKTRKASAAFGQRLSATPQGRPPTRVSPPRWFCYHQAVPGGDTMAAAKKNDDGDGIKVICRNKRAFHEYTVLDRLECGIVLTGTEVKSLREAHASLEDAYAKVDGGEVWLINSDIPEYTMGNRLNHKPKRPR